MSLALRARRGERAADSGLTRISYYPGEVFVLDDGGEADLDLGNYERYLNVTLGRDNNITTGKIYREVIEKEVRPHLIPACPSCRS